MPTTNLGIVYLDVAQEQKEVSINTAFDVIDAGVVVKSENNTLTGRIKITRTAVASGNPAPDFWVVAPADTGMTAGVESSTVVVDCSATRQWATGALATQRAVRFLAPTYGFVGASTLTTATTVSISGAPIAGTNATITNPYAFQVESGLSSFLDQVVITPTATGRAMTITHQTGFAGATIFINPAATTKRCIINFAGIVQLGTDTPFNNTSDWFVQSLSSGNQVINLDCASDVLTFGASNGHGSVNICYSAGALGFFGATAVARPSNTTDLRTALINYGLYQSGGATPLNLNGGTLTAGDVVGAPIGRVMVLCAGFTPASTGADVAEFIVPYDPRDGTTSITWNVRRIFFRVGTAGGAPQITVEKYTGTGVFSATTVGSVTLGSGANEGSQTSSFTTSTLASGDKVRFNVNTLATALNWTIELELGATT